MTKSRHMLNLKDWSSDKIQDIIRRAVDMKDRPGDFGSTLEGLNLCLLFQKTSTRTRASFEVGMAQMGGNTIYMDWNTTNFALSDLEDEARVLSHYVDCIVARMLRHSDLLKIAKGSRVPVINGCCEIYHPCQILGDLLTIREHTDRLEGSKIVYVGVHNNVCNSLIEGCTKLAMEITVVAPEGSPPSEDEELLESARKTGLYKTTLDVRSAVKEVDFIYTDTWLDMEYFSDSKYAEEKARRIDIMSPYQINEELLACNSRALVMHCLPAHKGYEITEGVVNGPRSIVFKQAENRLHAQKALLWELLAN